VVPDALDVGYRAMAADEARERKAKEWAEGLVLHLDDEAR
jgi:hypothetical protein